VGCRQLSPRRKVLFHPTQRGRGAAGCVALILGYDAARFKRPVSRTEEYPTALHSMRRETCTEPRVPEATLALVLTFQVA